MKTLIDKLRKVGRGVKKGLLVATAVASIGLASCDLCGPEPEPEPNYAPVASLSVNPTSIKTNENTYINLNGTDENGEEDIVEYKVGVDKNLNDIIDNDETIMTSSSPITDYPVGFSITGNKKILGQVKDSQGEVDKKSIEVIVSEPDPGYITISGTLEDNETNTLQLGEVRLYIDNIPSQPDSDGQDFSFSVLPNSNVKLKGMIKDAGIQKSYVRTLNLGTVTTNLAGVLVRAVPYDGPLPYDNGLLDTEQKRLDFIKHMDRVNFSAGMVGNHLLGLKKWNHEEPFSTSNRPVFEGIEVSNVFSESEFNQIKTLIQTSSYPNANYIASKIIRGEAHIGEDGWGRILLGDNSDSDPYNNAPSTIVWDQNGQDGYIEGFKTYLTYLQVSEFDINRHEEVGHGILFPGHASEDKIQKLFDLLMVWTSTDNNPKVYDFTATDIKGSYIVDEPTYLGMDTKEKILGTNF